MESKATAFLHAFNYDALAEMRYCYLNTLKSLARSFQFLEIILGAFDLCGIAFKLNLLDMLFYTKKRNFSLLMKYFTEKKTKGSE